jgi:hypothetical protein
VNAAGIHGVSSSGNGVLGQSPIGSHTNNLSSATPLPHQRQGDLSLPPPFVSQVHVGGASSGGH